MPGLGLAFCHHIVKLRGDTISVESVLGKGSIFEMRLLLT